MDELDPLSPGWAERLETEQRDKYLRARKASWDELLSRIETRPDTIEDKDLLQFVKATMIVDQRQRDRDPLKPSSGPALTDTDILRATRGLPPDVRMERILEWEANQDAAEAPEDSV